VQLAQEVQDGVVQERPDGCRQDGCKITRQTAVNRGQDECEQVACNTGSQH
jgi:hypothetical protein